MWRNLVKLSVCHSAAGHCGYEQQMTGTQDGPVQCVLHKVTSQIGVAMQELVAHDLEAAHRQGLRVRQGSCTVLQEVAVRAQEAAYWQGLHVLALCCRRHGRVPVQGLHVSEQVNNRPLLADAGNCC